MIEKKKIRCIFCGEHKESSREHIIPEALGNRYFVTYDVCTECNNRLGSEIDAPFVDDFLMRTARKALGIKGKQNSLPNIIAGTYEVDGGRKIRVDDEGHWSLLPAVKEENGAVQISASSKADGIRIVEENVKRRLKREGIEWTEDVRAVLMKHLKITEQPVLPPETLPQRSDFRAIYFGVLKIAYEYSSSILGGNYFNDEIAKACRRMLNNPSAASFEEIQRYIHHVPAPKDIVEPWTNKYHVLSLMMIEGIIGMDVALYGCHAWNFQIQISDCASNYSFHSPHIDLVPIAGGGG